MRRMPSKDTGPQRKRGILLHILIRRRERAEHAGLVQITRCRPGLSCGSYG
jgi:hypothetical protein